ncbi:MAG: tRNA lysidine(34) synthetase TilS [Paracoccaceae bacterium]|nr:tRNA lysidine(34) synthetase TilS [Paracoccaceae bacterium]MDG1371916.1 tRNA lysidine(34) synthetase TilS [Paracoccaceae bacterium]
MTDDIQAQFDAEIGRLHQGGSIGVAVSGGGDSVALLHLTQKWAAKVGVHVQVATVDHNLRAESAAEALGVAKACAKLGLDHQTLHWTGWNGEGNLQAEASAARRRLLADAARAQGLKAILLGHTTDDQAETLLMRLGRGSGVDGLSGMRPSTLRDGIIWLRPLLGVRRDTLRDWLRSREITWIDDPSNDDLRFDRVKARRALVGLSDLGITAQGLTKTAEHMQQARGALDHAAGALAAEATRWGACGEFYLSLSPYRAAPPEIQRRLLRAALVRTAGANYGPRADAEQKLLSAILSLRLGGGRSLHGCLIRPNGFDGVVITREAAATKPGQCPLWDGRFEVKTTKQDEGATIVALGETGARHLSKLEADGIWTPPSDWSAAPRAARLTTPALFHDDMLIAAPIAAYGDALNARFAPPTPWWTDSCAATV